LFFLLLCCVATNFAQAQDREYEIQYGAFLIKKNAETLKNTLTQIVPDVFISEIKKTDTQSLFSVRTGPFKKYDDAVALVDNLKQSNPTLTPMVMQKKSFTSATASDEVDEVDEVDEAPKKSEPPSTENATKPLDDQENYLWGEPAPNTEAATITDPALSAVESQERSRDLKALEAEMDELKNQLKTILDAEEVRGELQENQEEKKKKEEDILDAAGREYTLMKKGRFGFEYQLSYTYFAYDAITEINVIEHNSNHTLVNTFTIEYPFLDNLTFDASIPFVYEYDAVGNDDSKDVTDWGDVRFGASWQPIKSGPAMPAMILNATLTCPMGRSPYEVNPNLDLSTGSGGYALEGNVSLSKSIDPIMVYGTFSYEYRFPIENLDYKIGSHTLERFDRGDRLGFSVGMGYSVSYITAVTLGYSYSYTLKSKRYYEETQPQDYQTQTSSSLSIGSSWRLSKKYRINATLGIGLGNSEYFSLSFRLPMEFGGN
jgi:hypothetical protein